MAELSKYIPLIVPTVLLIAWFARLEYNSKENRGRIRNLEKKESELQPILSAISKTLERVETNISWLMKSKT